MTVADRGTKRRCPHCGAAFYDLGRDPVTCPKCHTLYVETAKLPVRASHRPRGAVAPAPAPEPEEEEAAAFDEDEVIEHDEDEAGDTLPDEQEDRDDE